jgi:hypothetical protein
MHSQFCPAILNSLVSDNLDNLLLNMVLNVQQKTFFCLLITYAWKAMRRLLGTESDEIPQAPPVIHAAQAAHHSLTHFAY